MHVYHVYMFERVLMAEFLREHPKRLYHDSSERLLRVYHDSSERLYHDSSYGWIWVRVQIELTSSIFVCF